MSGSATESSGSIACSASSSVPSMLQTMPQTLRRWISSGNGGAGGMVWKLKKPLTFRGADGSHSRYAASSLSVSSSAQKVGPPTTVVDRMRAEDELGHDAEVAAAAPDRPEQVGVLVGARSHLRPVGEHELRRQQIVDRQPVGSGQIAVPTAEGQTCDAGGRDDPGRDGEPVWLGGSVDLLHRQPPPTRTVRAFGSTETSRNSERSQTTPSSTLARPPPL